MEIKIGVQHAREVSFESSQSAQEVTAEVEKAITDGGLLRLTDDKGQLILVPGSAIAYVELGAPEKPRVGFGSL